MNGIVVIASCAGMLGCFWWLGKKAAPSPATNLFDAISPFYDRFMLRFGLYHVPEIRNSFTALRAQGSLLDIGGGTGYLVSHFTDLFSRIVVVDPSKGMLSAAKQRKIETVQASALNLPFPAKHFDAILCTDALHHIKDADRAIAEMSRVLKPGGTFIIMEFDPSGPAGRLFYWFERIFIDRSEFLTPAQLRSCSARHGLAGACRPISRLEYLFEGQKTTENIV